MTVHIIIDLMDIINFYNAVVSIYGSHGILGHCPFFFFNKEFMNDKPPLKQGTTVLILETSLKGVLIDWFWKNTRIHMYTLFTLYEHPHVLSSGQIVSLKGQKIKWIIVNKDCVRLQYTVLFLMVTWSLNAQYWSKVHLLTGLNVLDLIKKLRLHSRKILINDFQQNNM